MNDLMHLFATEVASDQPNRPPRDAATLILVDRSGAEPRVLLGRRHKSHVFVPGALVFPGGRVDPADRLMPTATPLHPKAEAALMRRTHRPSPAKARALALAAIRETFEETGILLGKRQAQLPQAPDGPWSAFARAGILPDLSRIHFIARAVTPPRRPRRYDTRFFAAEVSAIADRVEGVVGPDAELVELLWLTFDEAASLDLLAVTKLALLDLRARIEAGLDPALPVPYYRVLYGRRLREML
jgi:8-oxo-dGTP pyrophosphatase MutT (NUDIX family)